MESTLLLLLGMGLGIVWARAFPQLMGGPQAPSAPPPAVQPDALEVLEGKSAEAAPRAERLHKLGVALEAVTSSASHAKEVQGFDDFKAAATLMTDPAMPLADVIDYACGGSIAMAGAALRALEQRGDGDEAAERIVERIDGMQAWHLQFVLDYLIGLSEPLPIEAPLAGCQSWWEDSSVVLHLFHDYFTAMDKRGLFYDPTSPLTKLPNDRQGRIRSFLDRQRHPTAVQIAESLQKYAYLTETTSDPARVIEGFGRFWGAEQATEVPIEVPSWGPLLEDALKTFDHTPIRSILCSGEPLVGKTSFLKLAARQIEKRGWRVFEASGSDLQAGQQYIGQLEGRIKQVLEEASVAQKVVWYVPDLLALALSGTNQSQSASILDQVMPAIAAGRLVIWGEVNPKSSARLLQLRPAVRRSFEVIRLEPLDVADTKSLAIDVSRKIETAFRLTLDPGYIDGSITAAKDYLSAGSLPGSALALMKIGCMRSNKSAGGRRLVRRDVLDSLAQLTGLPQSILDGSERLDLAQTTNFFAKRVIGQPEAVASIVERIAMLKSGLNDPGKPFGVFLFAGPTGTGKSRAH